MADSNTAPQHLPARTEAPAAETKLPSSILKASYIEKDLLKNTVQTKELDVPPCVTT